MPKFCDYTEWDSDRDRRNAEEMKEPENPFEDPVVQRRIAEFIVQAALDIKKSRTVNTRRRRKAPSRRGAVLDE
jgi:hypothetical protein